MVIHRDLTLRKDKYYTVIQNPTVEYYDTKVIYGSTPQIVERKAKRQIEKWQKESCNKQQK